MFYSRTGRTSSNLSTNKKQTKAKKKTQARKEWDSSVNDLTVYRATNEELEQRREIHKSKNQWAARWELHNKVKKKEHRGTPDLLENTRLALMKEILSDQYLMNDVLERSDKALAIVKDLFGDAPRRHTGFPNVTIAPSSELETSCGPIAQKRDRPTQLSILSESIMDSHTGDFCASVSSEFDWSSSNQSSLGLLNGMVQEVVQDLEAYEETDRERDLLLLQEVKERHHLQGELVEQKMMIDALTAELLTLKEGSDICQTEVKPNRTGQSDVETFSMEEPRVASSIPVHLFQQAIMLSPPRQKTITEFSDQSARGADVNQPPHIGSVTQELVTSRLEKEGSKYWNNGDLTSQMEELYRQNAALKAQLQQMNISTGPNTPKSSISAPSREELNGEADSDTLQGRVTPVPMSLEMRIAELNRQSAEARDKLLKLIEQQKQNTVSPTLSPITPQGRQTDPSLDSTSPLSSRSSRTRVSGGPKKSPSSVSSSYSSLRSAPIGQGPQGEKTGGEGWFALSAHIS
ncbi:hypothetical protein GDO86_020099 [Hymenochirus boettgeri]|uniref:Spindle and centriole-associated protein 1 n=1 Tax=Hymenochirus boettgeri TaxID=247094 RepID=A0A8T2IML6_9PIPI|nr:hypothetical protein GDO86_020099 [Hymenochirus boettgeri]